MWFNRRDPRGDRAIAIDGEEEFVTAELVSARTMRRVRTMWSMILIGPTDFCIEH